MTLLWDSQRLSGKILPALFPGSPRPRPRPLPHRNRESMSQTPQIEVGIKEIIIGTRYATTLFWVGKLAPNPYINTQIVLIHPRVTNSFELPSHELPHSKNAVEFPITNKNIFTSVCIVLHPPFHTVELPESVVRIHPSINQSINQTFYSEIHRWLTHCHHSDGTQRYAHYVLILSL